MKRQCRSHYVTCPILRATENVRILGLVLIKGRFTRGQIGAAPLSEDHAPHQDGFGTAAIQPAKVGRPRCSG